MSPVSPVFHTVVTVIISLFMRMYSDRKFLRALTLVGPTRNNLTLDPLDVLIFFFFLALDVLHLHNQLYWGTCQY